MRRLSSTELWFHGLGVFLTGTTRRVSLLSSFTGRWIAETRARCTIYDDPKKPWQVLSDGKSELLLLENGVMPMDVKNVKSFDEMHEILIEGDECPGELLTLNLSNLPTPQDYQVFKDEFDDGCCGFAEGLFRLAGDIYYASTTFGH